MTRVVLDTNIIISAIFWDGNPHEIFARGISGDYQIVTSAEILDEVSDRLKNKFQFPDAATAMLIDIILTYSHVADVRSKFDAVRDKSDNKIIECAFDGAADFIVTGDTDLLELKEFRGIRIITAKEFLSILSS